MVTLRLTCKVCNVEHLVDIPHINNHMDALRYYYDVLKELIEHKPQVVRSEGGILLYDSVAHCKETWEVSVKS